MKTVEIKITGKGKYCMFENFCEDTDLDWLAQEDIINDYSLHDLEEEDIIDGELFTFPYLTTIDSITADGVDIQDSKGKYIKTKTFFKDNGINVPCYAASSTYSTFKYEPTYLIELEDDEEFDPSKLQLIKVDYEFEFIPYAIVISHIVYNGKEIYTDDDLERLVDERAAYTGDYVDDWYKKLM